MDSTSPCFCNLLLPVSRYGCTEVKVRFVFSRVAWQWQQFLCLSVGSVFTFRDDWGLCSERGCNVAAKSYKAGVGANVLCGLV